MPFARLKPINPLTGNIVERFSSPYGNVFRVEVGWYEVSEVEAKYLKQAHVDPHMMHSALAFDVYDTLEEASVFEERERLAKLEAHGGSEHHSPARAARPPRSPMRPDNGVAMMSAPRPVAVGSAINLVDPGRLDDEDFETPVVPARRSSDEDEPEEEGVEDSGDDEEEEEEAVEVPKAKTGGVDGSKFAAKFAKPGKGKNGGK